MNSTFKKSLIASAIAMMASTGMAAESAQGGAAADGAAGAMNGQAQMRGQMSMNSAPQAAGQAAPAPQGGARIQVQEQPAKIQVNQPEPKITVEQPAPNVIVQQPKPVVNVQTPEPRVIVNEAQPQVQVIEQGQPQVEVKQTGEVETRVTDRQESEGAAVSGRQMSQDDGSARADDGAMGALMSKRVSDIKGMDVENLNGDDIGDVEKVVRDPHSNKLFAVVSVGGFLGMGEKMIPISLESMQLRDDKLIAPTSKDEDKLENRDAYVAGQYAELDDAQTLGQAESEFSAMESKPGSAR